MIARTCAARLSLLLTLAGLAAVPFAGCGGSSPVTSSGDDAGGGDDSTTMKPVCGDGVVEAPEECDLGASNGKGMGCNDDCTWTCVATDPKRDCNTGNACAGTQTCQADHTCSGGMPLANGTMCGNGMVCVNGNCTAASCGDGVVEPGEECDDGNNVNGDGCDTDCKFSCVSTDPTRDCPPANMCVGPGTCNDTTHVCAPGTPVKDGTSCGSGLVCSGGMCGPSTCGDGIVSGNEQCDFGMGNNVKGSGCDPNCQFSCTTSPNSCDDGNPCNGVESCNSVTGPNGDMGQKCAAGTPEANGTSCGTNGMTCLNGVCTLATCGNGTIDPGEQCDLGANNGKGLGCNAGCQFDCQTSADCTATSVCAGTPTCVGATVMGQNVQKCQAGTDAAKCSTCTNGLCDGMGNCNASVCGDGCVDPSRGETCDPPNGTTCDANCHTLAVCGNGVIEGSEQCDDGNTRDLDGCDSKCNYEAVARMTTMAIASTQGPAFCVHPANALGTQVLTSLAVGQLNSTLATDVNSAKTNVMTQFLGLTDLTGVSAKGFQIGVMSASLDPAKGTWTGTSATNQPIDWWFWAAASTVQNGLPTGVLSNGALSARNLSAGPSNVSLTLSLGGSPALLEMLNAAISATIDGNPAPNVPAPPPSALANGLTVFQQITGSGTGQGLCGDITVESLAQIPIPQVIAQGGQYACAACPPSSHAYTYCGMGQPVGPNCNSLLDAIVGGCSVGCGLISFSVINATATPDVAANGTAKTLSLGTNNKVPSLQSTGDKDAYSSYMTFDGERAHFTSQTCTANTDCQSGLTCQTGECK